MLVFVASLTKLILALDGFCGEGRFSLSHLIDGRDPELVARSILQPCECELPVHQLRVPAHTYETISANHAGLENILGHFGATIISGGPPGDRDGVLGDSSDDQVLWTLWNGWMRQRQGESEPHFSYFSSSRE